MKQKLLTPFILILLILTGCNNPSQSNNLQDAFDYVKMANCIRLVTRPYYDKSGVLAQNNETAREFTDHKIGHIEMVNTKSLEVATAVINAVNNGTFAKTYGSDGICFTSNIDTKTLIASSLSHDTGMCGDGYALVPDLNELGKQKKDEYGRKMFKKENGIYIVNKEDNSDFDTVRNNHSLNSAINVLINRPYYIIAGFTNDQIEKIAAECMAHSKSGSGVSNLNRRSDWADSFDRIDAVVKTYNAEHPNSTITFNRSAIENNDLLFSSMISESLALRIGDVSRDSGPDAEAQSGEKIHVERTTLNNQGGTYQAEVSGASIKFLSNGDNVTSEKSRQVHAGEQNITFNRTYTDTTGKITHEITINEGTSAPYSTQEALNDHIEEFACFSDYNFNVKIIFTNDCDEYSRNAYENFRTNSQNKITNVKIIYPWD